MRLKTVVALAMTFAFAFGLTAGVKMATAGEAPPIQRCQWPDYMVHEGDCCDVGTTIGVWDGTGCRYYDNIHCTCAPMENPNNCPLYCEDIT